MTGVKLADRLPGDCLPGTSTPASGCPGLARGWHGVQPSMVRQQSPVPADAFGDGVDQAAADLDTALSLDPQQPEALLERGIVRRLQGNNAGARADWHTLTETSPKTPAAESARLNLERMDKGE